MRKPIIAGNWKLNLNSKEALALLTELRRSLSSVDDVEMIVCPPFTTIDLAVDTLFETNIGVGAQNMFWEDSGAFTGEVSAPFLKDLGVQYVIIGHSERRQYFGETNQTINKKIKAALKHGLTPIVCVGEILKEREDNQTFAVIEKQCRESLEGLSAEDIKKCVIAYEPVWAIGTGKTATKEQAQEVHKFIRDLLGKIFGDDTALGVRIQYGGSVKAENIAELMSQADIDGALVGGASLKSDHFIKIIENTLPIYRGGKK